MKKFVIAILGLTVILTFVYGVVSPLILPNISTFEKNIEIDKNKNIVLDFKGYTVKIVGWDMDYVRVKSNLAAEKDQTLNLASNSNRISISNPIPISNPELISKNVVYETGPWLPILQLKKYKHFYNDIDSIDYNIAVNVPKNTAVKVFGKYIRTDGCTVSYVEGDEAVIRDSSLTKDFKDNVEDLSVVRDCKIPKSVVFKKIDGEIRDNTLIDD